MAKGRNDIEMRVTADSSGVTSGLKPMMKGLDDAKKSAQETEAALDHIGVDPIRLKLNNEAVANARKEIDRLRDEIAHELLIDPKADTRAAEKQIRKLQQSIRVLDAQDPKVEVDVVADESGLAGLSDSLKTATAAAVGFGGVVGGWKLVGLAADVETTTIALSSLTGSVQEGEQAFKDLQKFAATTPYELDQVTQSARSLLAAGVDAGDLPDMLTDLGNAASAVGAPLEEVALVFQQMLTKGKVSNEEMLQLAERGVPAYQALASAMGLTVAQVQEMATKGQLGTDAIDLLGKTLGDMFPTSMEDQAQSLNGQLSTLKDNITQLGQGIGNVFLPVAKTMVADLNNMVGPISTLVGKFGDLPGPVKDAAGELLSLTALLVPAVFFGPKIIGAITTAISALKTLGITATITGAKMKAAFGGLIVAGAIAGLDALSNALADIFNMKLDPTNLNREMRVLANSGEVIGNMRRTFHADLSGLRGDLWITESTFQKFGNALVNVLTLGMVDTPLDHARQNIEDLDAGLAELVDAGHIDEANALWEKFRQKGLEAGLTLDEIKEKFPQYEDALEAATIATEFGSHAMDDYVARLKTLEDRISDTTDKLQSLRDAFTPVNTEATSSMDALSGYEDAIDNFAQSLVENGPIFDLDKVLGRQNWALLEGLAESTAPRVRQTFEDLGRDAATAQLKGFRQNAAQMLFDAGLKDPKQVWKLVNQAFKEPIQFRAELAEEDLTKLQRQRTKLLKEKEGLEAPFKVRLEAEGLTPKAIDTLNLEMQKATKKVDVKLAVNKKDKDQAKDDMGDLIKPKGKNHVAKVDAKVTGESLMTAEEALNNFINAPRPPIKIKVEVETVTVSGVEVPLNPPSYTPGGRAAPSAAPSTLAGATTAMMTTPAPTATGSSTGWTVGRQTTGQQGAGSVTRLAPRQTPVAVYLDGVEIAHRIEARRALAASESVRRTA